MTINPEELLIFKKRKDAEEAHVQEGAKKAVGMQEQKPAAQQRPAEQTTKPAERPSAAVPAARHATAAPAAKQPITEKQRQQQAVEASKPGKKEDLSGAACVNHPWRKAYARCEYCHMPFCYADTMPFHGKIYCLEDIDRATRMHLKPVETPSRFMYFASMLFALSTILLIYIAYVPARYLASSVMGITAPAALIGIVFQYSITVTDLLLAALSFVAAVVIIRRTPFAFGFGAAVLTLVLIFMSYEYIASNAQNLYAVLAVTLINMASIVAGKMDIAGSMSTRQLRLSIESIEWPRPELF